MVFKTTGYAAKTLGVHAVTIKNWFKNGKFPNSHVDESDKGIKRYWIDERDITNLLPSDEVKTEQTVIAAVKNIEKQVSELKRAQNKFKTIIEQYKTELYKEKRENANQIDLTPILQEQRVQGEKLDKLEQQISNLSQLPETLQTLIDIVTQRTIPKDMDTSVKKPNMKRSLPDDYNKFGGR